MNIFSVLYCQGGRTFAAEVLARDEREAVEVFWQKAAAGSPLIDPGDIQVESVEELAPAEAVPYPEALPDGPALLAVVELGKSEER
ncbi:MAG: hypothetical protein QXU79_00700 [Candidatus Micrarchaeaceae archaeon]